MVCKKKQNKHLLHEQHEQPMNYVLAQHALGIFFFNLALFITIKLSLGSLQIHKQQWQGKTPFNRRNLKGARLIWGTLGDRGKDG